MTSPAILAPVARILMALIFIIAGLQKLGNVEGTAAYIESGGLPGILVWPSIALEVIGGAMVALGIVVRPMALALAAFSVVTAVIYHLIPGLGLEGAAQRGQMIHVMKNLSMAGGFLLLTLHGPGAHSLGK